MVPGQPADRPLEVDGVLAKMLDYIASHQVFVQDVFACADPRYGSGFAS